MHEVPVGRFNTSLRSLSGEIARHIQLSIEMAPNVPATSNSNTTFVEVLQSVPLLLQACVVDHPSTRGREPHNHSGLATLRLVCKPAIVAVVQAISKYRLRLSSQPSNDEPPSDVAKLLCHSRLHQLAVDIVIPQGAEWCLSRHSICNTMSNVRNAS